MESPKGNKGGTLTLYFLLVTLVAVGHIWHGYRFSKFRIDSTTITNTSAQRSPYLISFFFYFLHMRYKDTRCYSAFTVLWITVGSTLFVIVLMNYSLGLVSSYSKARFFQGGTSSTAVS